MPRLLHVSSRPADFQTLRAIDALARGCEGGCTVPTREIGPGGDYANVPAAALGLRREAAGTDVAHAWGSAALSAVAFAGFGRIVFTPTEFPTRRQVGWLRAVMSYRDVQVVCPTSTVRRWIVQRGVPVERCHLIRPGVDFARVNRRRDPRLRAAFGLGDEDHVLLAVGESTRAADHLQAVWAGSILNVFDPRTRVLLSGRGPMAEPAARFALKQRKADLVTLADRRLGRVVEFEELLPAADLLVVSATGPVSTLPIAIAMAAGLPIAATVTPTVAELLEDRHTALMTQPGVPRLLAEKILQLREDSQLQWSLSDMARTEAYEYFSLTRFREQFRDLYRQVAAGGAVDVPEPAAGAGRRFHGRA
jgi:glycosyltransferase involved in cell wall biosynthesis